MRMDIELETESHYIAKLQALDRRTASSHLRKEHIQAQLKKGLAGVKGETALTYPLKFLPETDYTILHNPRLPDHDDHFEIDRLLLSTRYVLLLEAKNWYGTLYFDGEKQVIRVGDDDREEGLPNPIPQVKLQRHRLQQWLRSHDFPPVPILYFVVISFPSTIVKPLYPEYPVPFEVIHSKSLFNHIQQLNRKYTKPVVSQKKLMEISNRIVDEHKPSRTNVLDRFGIHKNELVRGVICPACTAYPMLKQDKKWLCPRCQNTSANAHLSALYDHKLLIGDHITNRGARDFLQITSPSVTKRLLQKEKFPAIGKNKTRKYILEFDKRL